MKLQNTIFVNGFADAFSRLLDERLPIGIAFVLRRFAKEYDDKFKVFAQTRLDLFKKYGNEKDGEYKVPKKNLDKFNEEFEQLLEIEQEFDIKKVSLPKDTQMSAKDVAVLENILDIKE